MNLTHCPTINVWMAWETRSGTATVHLDLFGNPCAPDEAVMREQIPVTRQHVFALGNTREEAERKGMAVMLERVDAARADRAEREFGAPRKPKNNPNHHRNEAEHLLN